MQQHGFKSGVDFLLEHVLERVNQATVLRQGRAGFDGGKIGGYGAAVERLAGFPAGEGVAVVGEQQA